LHHFLDFQASEPNRPVWKGKKPNRTEINRFEPVFGSVRFKKNLKKILVWLFILVQNRTELKMLLIETQNFSQRNDTKPITGTKPIQPNTPTAKRYLANWQATT
jgi:hypothetical protein